MDRLEHRTPDLKAPPAHAGDRSGRIAVVGGGWAGCAAAVELASRGARVILYEQAPMLGGRARTIAVDGQAFDNGQHLLIGAYRGVLALLERLHGRPNVAALFHRLPITVRPYGRLAASAPSFVAGTLPAPWHLARAIVLARRLSVRERWAVLQDFRRLEAARFERPDDETVEQCFGASPPRVYDALWAPLCLAALNTPPARASARIFANVLGAAFTGDSAASEFLVPSVHLGSLLPEPAAKFIEAHGGKVRLGERVRAIAEHESDVCVSTATARDTFDAVIVAAGPHQLRQLEIAQPTSSWTRVCSRVAAFTYQSINTVYLAYARAAMPAVLARLDDAPGQWVFDRDRISIAGERLRLLAVVISANGPHDHLHQPALVAQADAQLRRLDPSLLPLRFGRVIAERRATYACTPLLARPAAGAVTRRIHLAGDYTHPRFPATLEAAVQSGIETAASVLHALRADVAAG